MKVRPLAYKIIFLTGVDGCGKTFLLQRLIDVLESQGYPSIHIWSRFNNYLSKPLLAFARFWGLSYYENTKGVRVGYHDFEKSPVISFLFIWLQLCDVWIASICKFWIPIIKGNVVIVADRGPHDTLMDVAIDTGQDDLPRGFFQTLFISAVPFPHKILFIDRDQDKIESSRPDVKCDRKFQHRLKLYVNNAEHLGFKKISNNGTVEQTMGEIMAELFNEKKETTRLDS